MNYYDQIDPIGMGNENSCLCCGAPTSQTYCSIACKVEDNN